MKQLTILFLLFTISTYSIGKSKPSDKIPEDIFDNKVAVITNIITPEQLEELKNAIIDIGFETAVYMPGADLAASNQASKEFAEILKTNNVKYTLVFPLPNMLVILDSLSAANRNYYKLSVKGSVNELFKKFRQELDASDIYIPESKGTFSYEVTNLKKDQTVANSIPSDYKSDTLLVVFPYILELRPTSGVPANEAASNAKYNKYLKRANIDRKYAGNQLQKKIDDYPYPYKFIKEKDITQYKGKAGYYYLDVIETKI